MKRINRIGAFVSSVMLLLTGCAQQTAMPSDVNAKPDVYAETNLPENGNQTDGSEAVLTAKQIQSDIYAAVCSAVSASLCAAGFSAEIGTAEDADHARYQGVYYYCDEIDFGSESAYHAAGFVEVAAENTPTETYQKAADLYQTAEKRITDKTGIDIAEIRNQIQKNKLSLPTQLLNYTDFSDIYYILSSETSDLKSTAVLLLEWAVDYLPES